MNTDTLREKFDRIIKDELYSFTSDHLTEDCATEIANWATDSAVTDLLTLYIQAQQEALDRYALVLKQAGLETAEGLLMFDPSIIDQIAAELLDKPDGGSDASR